MRPFARARSLWRSLRHASALGSEMEEEFHFHMERRAEDLVRRGLSPDEAIRRARLEFGSTARYREEGREARGLRFLDAARQDLRYALRSLRKAPGFTVVAVLTMALGIGANAAIFSVVNAAILRPLAYPQPRQLVFLNTDAAGPVSPAEYWELTEINQSFSVVGAFVTGEVNLSARDQPRRVRRASVNAELLEALAVPPELGRWFRREETRAGGPPVVILSHQLWQSAFAGRKAMVGELIEIDGVKREVVGIMPPGFDLLDRRVDLWLPLQLASSLRQFRASHFLSVVGRLKNGVTPQQAKTELALLVATWAQRTGASGHVFTPGGHVVKMEPLLEEVIGSARRALVTQRRREFGIRMALGADRALVLRRVIGHGLKLTCVGLVAGLAGAVALGRLLEALLFEVGPNDPATLAGVAALITAVAAAASLVPAFRATRVDPMMALRDE